MVRLIPLVALVLLVPLAAADHVFSHRIVLAGRLIGPDDLPVPAQPVTVRFHGFEAEGRCFDSREERTGPQGDFSICRHAHELPARLRVNVTAAGASLEREVDPALRRASFLLRAPADVDARDIEGERIFARTFRVEGRVMQLYPGPSEVEGVRVPSEPLGGRTVRIALSTPSGPLAEANATANEHGDYALDLDLADVPEAATVRIEVGGAVATASASPAFRRADVDLVLAPPEEELGGERPGTRTPEVTLPALLALGALALAAAARRR